jgi:membrane-associated progesterone receptor component
MDDANLLFRRFWEDIVQSPLNMFLLGLIVYFSYRLFIKDTKKAKKNETQPKKLAKMPKQDFTLTELQPFNGKNEEGRILIAVLGRVFDVSASSQFYGPGIHIPWGSVDRFQFILFYF